MKAAAGGTYEEEDDDGEQEGHGGHAEGERVVLKVGEVQRRDLIGRPQLEDGGVWKGETDGQAGS